MPSKPVKKAVRKTKSSKAPTLKTPRVPKAPNKPTKDMSALPAVVPPMPPVSVRSEADKIWDEIKSLPIQMFGLPGQIVSQHVQPFPIEPSKLYLTIRSSATLPSLETAVGDKFTVEQADRFVIVARVAAPLFPKR